VLSAYARARGADSLGAAGAAAEGYAALLAVAPDNELLAARAVNQAIAAGDRAIAVRAARILERKGLLAPDTRLLLISEALRTRDWKSATAHVDALGQDKVFGFMAPVMRAWIAFETGSGDPVAILAGLAKDDLAAGYAAEHGPLLLLARGKTQGVPELLSVAEALGPRASRLRIAGAATLARKGERKAAEALLAGEAESITAARAMLAAGKPIPGAVDSASAGVAELLIRIAADLGSQNVDDLALSYARLATFLAPTNSEAWLLTAVLLGEKDRHRDALAAIGNVAADDPYAEAVQDARIRLLVRAGDLPAALARAKAGTEAPGADIADWSRYGDVLIELERFEEAGAAYDRAIALAAAGKGGVPWALWLQKGGALEQANRWPEAKAALQKAYELAPKEAVVLNYLGYAQLERRENVEAATALIAEANRLQPDSAEITDSLGWAFYLRGNVRAAIPLLEKAAAARPDDPEINEHLGDAYYSAGRRYEARYAWQAALVGAGKGEAERLRAKIDAGLTPKLASP